jgi:hypothetical protein
MNSKAKAKMLELYEQARLHRWKARMCHGAVAMVALEQDGEVLIDGALAEHESEGDETGA